jgi:hypothetical protein
MSNAQLDELTLAKDLASENAPDADLTEMNENL